MADLTLNIDQPELVEAIRRLTDAVRYQSDKMATTGTTDGGLYASTFAPVKSTPTLQQHGYARGDRVVLFNGDGTLRFATLPQDSERYVYSEKIPVDLDNGETDAWPVKMVLKVDANTQQYIDKLNPVPFGKGTPPQGVNRHEWNAAALKLAVDEGLVARFDYQKAANSLWDQSKQEPRTVRPVRFDGMSSSDPSRQAIVAVDLELPSSADSRFRTFRLDRITNLVRVSEDNATGF